MYAHNVLVDIFVGVEVKFSIVNSPPPFAPFDLQTIGKFPTLPACILSPEADLQLSFEAVAFSKNLSVSLGTIAPFTEFPVSTINLFFSPPITLAPFLLLSTSTW